MGQFTAYVKMEGLKAIDDILRQLPERVAGDIMQDSLLAAGEVVRKAAAGNIHSRTGKTAADIRVEVQVAEGDVGGAAAIGGTRRGRSGREHVLRWLEFGTRSARKPIVAGARAKRVLKTAVRRAVRNRDLPGAVKIAQAARIKKALTLPGGILRASAKHRGIAAQGPLLRALVDQSDNAIKVFRDTAWAGIVRVVERLRGAA